MPHYEFTYFREQRVYFELDADSEEQAMEAAEKHIKQLDLSSKDDESDDPGELICDGEYDVYDEE